MGASSALSAIGVKGNVLQQRAAASASRTSPQNVAVEEKLLPVGD